jgi:hypothetical protein
MSSTDFRVRSRTFFFHPSLSFLNCTYYPSNIAPNKKFVASEPKFFELQQAQPGPGVKNFERPQVPAQISKFRRPTEKNITDASMFAGESIFGEVSIEITEITISCTPSTGRHLTNKFTSKKSHPEPQKTIDHQPSTLAAKIQISKSIGQLFPRQAQGCVGFGILGIRKGDFTFQEWILGY